MDASDKAANVYTYEKVIKPKDGYEIKKLSNGTYRQTKIKTAAQKATIEQQRKKRYALKKEMEQ